MKRSVPKASTTPVADVIVAGLGAMGSATAACLARRGHRVLGFDRFAPPHPFGSTPGKTRIIREAYYEHPQYVPLVQRAYECWAEAGELAGEKLLLQTGGLMIGAPDGNLIAGTRRSAEVHGLPHEKLTAQEIRQRFPAFELPEWMHGIWEPRAGLLFPDRCIANYLRLARQQDAILNFDEPVEHWQVDGGGITVTTARGRYSAARLVLTAGAWMPELIAGLGVPLQVQRVVQYWFEPTENPEQFDPARFPVYLLEYAPPNHLFYGLPNTGDGVKAAHHHPGEPTTANSLNRVIAPEEVGRMRELLGQYLPHVNGRLLQATACMYTNTPDLDFVIDVHPAHPQVIVASPCSGHGFKFSSAIGEVLADLAMKGSSAFDLAPFSLQRFR